jgi:biopolymer transport protein ExbD
MPDIRSGGFRRRKVSMTSLIDAIFLLLLFFMLSSTFARQGEVPLDLAKGGAMLAPETPPAFVQLGDGRLTLDSVAVTLAELVAGLSERGADGVVLVSLSGQTSAQDLTEVIHAVQGISGWRLAVLGPTP